MKKILLVFLAFLLAIPAAYAANECSITSAGSTGSGNDKAYSKYIVTVECTAAADGSVSDLAFSAVDNLNDTLQGRGDWYLIQVRTYPGSTGPTDDTDLKLNITKEGNTIDVLGGAGTDRIDNAAYNDFYPKNTEGDYRYYPVDSDFTQNVTNNSVNAGNFFIEYVFGR